MGKDIIIEGIKISNPDKVQFKKSGITKKEVALYYQKIAPRMMPYLKDRLISTIRCPSSIAGDCFFKKHLESNNVGLGMIKIPSKNRDRKEDYYYVKDISGVIFEVQMNTIEFHIWGCRAKQLNKPDIMVFDLDPDEGLGLEAVRQGVKDLKKILDQLGLVSFLKTSGGKGYHVVVPVTASNWDMFKDFAKNIVNVMVEKWPEKYTNNVRKINRKGRIFIDWIRNTKTATSVAPYSLRIKKDATISMPINWYELDKVAPDSINIQEAIKRLKRKDPWEQFFAISQKID